MDSLRDLRDNIKRTGIHIIGAIEGEDREKGAENIFEDTVAENFPNLGKEVHIQVQELQTGCLNSRHLFLKILEAGKSKIKVSANLVLGENLFPGLQVATFLLCLHMVQREKELWSLFLVL